MSHTRDKEYFDQIATYARMATTVARDDKEKLRQLIESLDSLPQFALKEVLKVCESEVINMSEEARLPIWAALLSVISKHREYPEATWALPAGIVDEIERVASKVAPEDPNIAHRVLFKTNARFLFAKGNDSQQNIELLEQRRVHAVQQLYQFGGTKGVLNFALRVEESVFVGFALGKFESANVAKELLPHFILSKEPKWRDFIRGFIFAIQLKDPWVWLDDLNTDSWSKEEVAQVLTYLPFEQETWTRAQKLLGDDAREYWTRVPIGTYQRVDAGYVAIDALLRHGRPRAALACLASLVYNKRPLDSERALLALRESVKSKETGTTIDAHGTASVIKGVQEDENADKSKLIAVEWAYLSLLEHSSITRARTLNVAMAEDPEEFCAVIRLAFRSDHKTDREKKRDATEQQQATAMNAYRLLHEWATVPGTDASGNISSAALIKWVDAAKASLTKSGHLDVGLQLAGSVFIHAPADSDGFFINHGVAAILNREDMDQLRRGYVTAVYNSRGVHWVDPTGAPEKTLSLKFKDRAEAAENAGYHRFATTLRSIADRYEREASQVVARHQ